MTAAIAAHPRVRTEIESAVLAAYRASTPGSAARHAEARRVMPGGDTRTIAFHAPYPLYAVSGSGATIEDVDGNRYADYLNNYTSLIHGHAHPATVAAVAEQLPRGTVFATAIEAQTRLAGIMTERVASLDLLRFCNSGTEATMNAVRAARAFTGRDVIVKMEGGYHGSYDDFEVSVHPDVGAGLAGSAHAPLPVLGSRGVPANTVENVLVAPFNNVPAMERLLTERGEEVAAVIVEPVLGAAGMIPSEQEFLEALRVLTAERGIVLIFDEVMSFRLEPGGYQEHVRVRPDLTTFAKIIGGGFPIGAFGGREAIMALFDPSGPAPLSQSGTFNGNAVSMVAGVAAMAAYPAPEVARINALGDRLRAGLQAALDAAGVSGVATGYGSFVGVHLVPGPVRSYRDAARGDAAAKRLLHLALLAEGVFCAPRLMFCTSTAMDEATIDATIGAFGRVVGMALSP